jgi:dihydrofolate synthase/folylpolyglutamate synthase
MLERSAMTTPSTSHPDYARSLEYLFAQTRAGAPRSAGRMRALMAQLGLTSPRNVIHVVGTNGKGSVAAALAAAYRAEGVPVGCFLSPHVSDFRERVAVDGEAISEAEVVDFVTRLRARGPLEVDGPGRSPAFFELALALALEHFSRHSVEVAVIEAGVGAKHDATRALNNVRSVVLTNIGRDHLDTLGPTLKDVALDKADAIRPGVPILSSATGEVVAVLAEVASARRSPLFLDLPKSRLFELPAGAAPQSPTQGRNGRLAAATLRLAGVSEAAIAAGLQARLPARAERFSLRGREVLLDGAHNPDAARALLELARPPFVLVFGAQSKKLGEETLRVLEPHAERVVITDVRGERSALTRAGRTHVAAPEEALTLALSSPPEGADVLVTGSFYLAGQLRPLLMRRSTRAATPLQRL